MNENLNLAEILKNCPKGTKFYSTVFGEVEFDKIKEESIYPIICVTTGGYNCATTANGRYYETYDGECTLFPSKDQRDWSKFNAPWYKQDKDDERLRKTTIAFLKDFAEQGYENAVECIDWLEKQDEDKKEINNFDVLPGLYKCIHRMFDGTPDGRLLFEIDNVYKCLSKHDRAEFEVSYGHSVYLEDPIVRKYFIPFEGEQIPSPKFKVGDKIVNSFRKYMRDLSSQGIISKITNDKYIFTDGSYIFISEQDSWELVSNRFDRKTLDDEMIKTAILNHLKKMWGNCQDDICGVHVEDAINWLETQGEPNPYSGVSFKYNGHTWCMYGRDNEVEILVDGEIKERIFLDNKPKGKSALEAIKEEKVDNANKK